MRAKTNEKLLEAGHHARASELNVQVPIAPFVCGLADWKASVDSLVEAEASKTEGLDIRHVQTVHREAGNRLSS